MAEMARRMRRGSRRADQCGITYLWTLFLVFLLGLGIGKSLEIYSTQIQREKLADARYDKALYDKAMQAYYDNSPGYVHTYPDSQAALLADPRHLTLHRYLRRPIAQDALELACTDDCNNESMQATPTH
jgi:hypothetical protein